MKKSEIFQIILQVVCRSVEIMPSDVLSRCRKEDVVTARSIIVALCKKRGFRNYQLQNLLHFKSHNAVKHLADVFAQRIDCDNGFRCDVAYAERELQRAMAESWQK